MKTIRWIVLLGSLQFLVGCASTGGMSADSVSQETSPPEVVPSTLPVKLNSQDEDMDGVLDADDKCINSKPRVLVDASGCEIVTGVIEGLEFGLNETELSVDSRVILSKLVDAFQRYPDVVIAVEGHTDNRGPAAENLELSKQRVLSVVRYMVSQGIAAERIKPYGYGESRPRAANATPEGREQNRRIEIYVVEGLL